MNCGAARKHLYLLRDPDAEDIEFPIEAEAVQARSHLARCADCREFFAAEDRLKDFVKSRAPREKAPTIMRERILARIAQERRSSAGRSRWFGLMRSRVIVLALVGFTVFAAVMGGFWLGKSRDCDRSQQLASILVEDHVRNLPGLMEVTASDHIVVQSWFQRKVDFSFRLPPGQDPSLVGGRLCNLQGRRAALILYQRPQSRVSLFIFDGTDFDLPDDRLIAIDGKRCLVDTRKGFNVVLWKERGLIHGIVSDERSADLLQLAAQF